MRADWLVDANPARVVEAVHFQIGSSVRAPVPVMPIVSAWKRSSAGEAAARAAPCQLDGVASDVTKSMNAVTRFEPRWFGR